MNGYDALIGMSEIDADLIYEAETVKKRRAVYAWRWAVAAAALILCMGITVPVMAMTGNEKVYEILYMISPELAQKLKPVNMSCEDSGILMTVVAADVHDDRAEVLISLKDLTDNRLDGTTDLFDSYSIHTPYDQLGGCSLAGFDEESGELIYMISVEQMDHVLIPGDKITFSISQLLTGKKHFELSIDQIDTANLPVIMECLADPNFRGYSGSDIEDGMQIIIPGEEVLLDEGVTLTGYGLVDGQLHVQIKYDDIYHTDNHGFLYLEKEDTDRVLYAGSYAFWDESHTDSYEEYVFDIPAEELQEYRLGGEFWTCTGGPIEGDWSVTFPLS